MIASLIDKQIAVSLMEMVLKMDAGAIYSQILLDVDENDNYASVEKKLVNLCIDPLIDLVKKFASGDHVCKIEQDESRVTFCKRIFLDDCYISWNKSPFDIHNLIRATSTRPGAWTKITVNQQEKKCKILKTLVHSASVKAKPGTILEYSTKTGWIVQCAGGTIEILKVQLEGKKVMNARDFINGFKDINIFFSISCS